jgi:SlyX protein
MSELENQLIELQTRVAFHEDALEQLNDVIAKQDADIIQLKQQLRLLAKRLEELHSSQGQGDAEITNDRPPHY